MYKKIIIPLLCVAFLCGCTVKVETKDNNTTSNITETTENGEETTTVLAEPVEALSDLSIEKIVWGPGNIENHQKPVDPSKLNNKYKKLDALWLLDDEKKICLTFDEGYENGFTPAILDTLKEKNVKAMFFVTYDFASANKDLIKRMIDEGHIVGNHTWHHYDMTTIDADTVREEILYLHEYIQDNFNYTMSYFRFPEGSFSEQNLGITKELNYKSIFWSYAYADWDTEKQIEPTKAFTGICESTHPGEIMLLHAVSKTNAEILGRVIDDVRKQGYEFTLEV